MDTTESTSSRHGCLTGFSGWSLRALLPLMAAVALFAPGCQDPNQFRWPWEPTPQPKVPAGKISVSELATQLNMNVTNSSFVSAELRNKTNSVMIFSDPGGRAFVNGRAVDGPNGYEAIGATIYVPEKLADLIKPKLRPLATIEPQQPKKPIANNNVRVNGTVVIDAGHGGKDPGTTAISSCPEKKLNLVVAMEVARILRSRGMKVVLTRSSDVFIELDERVRIANSSKADLFVSIHANAVGDRSIVGHEVIMPAKTTRQTQMAANLISENMAEEGSIKRAVRPDSRGLRVLTKTNVPAVLVELGFMTNSNEGYKLTTSAHQQRLAVAIADGVTEYMRK